MDNLFFFLERHCNIRIHIRLTPHPKLVDSHISIEVLSWTFQMYVGSSISYSSRNQVDAFLQANME